MGKILEGLHVGGALNVFPKGLQDEVIFDFLYMLHGLLPLVALLFLLFFKKFLVVRCFIYVVNITLHKLRHADWRRRANPFYWWNIASLNVKTSEYLPSGIVCCFTLAKLLKKWAEGSPRKMWELGINFCMHLS
uniref:Uncharacterized protein n=1 Tax=Rhipicephalus microplus TaxID=6941 RepID=A0A6G5AEP3_RHIMP